MISIVIPNYNGEKYLRDCLTSIRQQEGVEYEIILIDNASTDSDYLWLQQEPGVYVERLDQNYGFSKAVNIGIRHAKGDYVLLLNNDTILCPGFLHAILETMEKDHSIFAVSSKMIRANEPDKIDDAGDAYTLLGWTKKRGDGQVITCYTKEEEVFSACAGAALYRKEVFEQIGGLDEAFFAYMEDVDLSYRARIYGYKNMYCPKALVYHIGSATSGSRYNPFKVRLAARNNVYVVYKNMPLLQLIVNLPFLFTGWLIKYLFFCKKGYGKVYREGLLEGFKTLDQVTKVKYHTKHLKHYLYIEYALIKNLLLLIRQ